MKNLIISLISITILVALTSGKPIKLKDKEAIIIGRIILDNDSEIENNKLEIAFQTGPRGAKKAKADTAGLFCTKIAIGNSFVDYVKYKEGGDYRKIFSADCITFSLPEGGKIYYIGDIYLKWVPSERDKVKKGFSLGIGLGGSHMGGGLSVPISSAQAPGEDCPGISIMDKDDAIQWFRSMYPEDNREIVTQFVNLLP